MANVHHRINYVELTVSDLDAAKEFYRKAFGWEFNEYGPSYAGIRGEDGEEVGGLFESDEPRGAGGPFVILFSADLAESIESIVAAGGKIISGPYPFPGGKRLHFTDPSGNELGVWAEATSGLVTPVELAAELGHLPEARPGLKVRNYLRSKYPNHEKYQRWLLSEEQADDVRAHFGTRV